MSSSSNNITAAEACNFTFPDSQGKNYRKTDFILHSRVAELVGDQLGRVFYDDEKDRWVIRASQLRDLVLTNILQEGDDVPTLYSLYPIYGSAVAFDPGVYQAGVLLEEGVTYPASSETCLGDVKYCTTEVAYRDLQLTELNQNHYGLSLYCPYAFRGPPNELVYQNCSREQPEFCPSMDLSFAYDYSDITVGEAEWYTVSQFFFHLSWCDIYLLIN